MQWATLGFLRLGVPEFNLLNPNVQSYMNAFFLIFTKSGGDYDCTPGSPFSRNDSPGLEWLEIRYDQMKQKTIPVI